MKMYVFETIQPDDIFAVIANSIDEAIELVDKEAGWTQRPPHGETTKMSVAEKATITSWSVGLVYHKELPKRHVMGG